jgi:hypothetical protein
VALALASAVVLLAAACTTRDPVPSASTTTTRPGPNRTTTTTAPPPTLRDRTLVGAYYSLWNPENLAQGWLRNRLRPPQRDMDAQAHAPDHGMADDVHQAATHGIDFFAVDWWPGRARQNDRLDQLLAVPDLGAFRFCVFYETQQLGFDPSTGTTLLTPRAVDRFVADLTDLGHRYLGHPNYLRVGGRPVVVLYLTRTLVGDVAGAVAQGRAALQQQGFDVLLVGDEVFWTVARSGPRRGPTVRVPQPARAELFDAITAYNLYESRRPGLAGYGAGSSFVADARTLYDTYRYATGGRVPVVPGVLPGFNDRGVRSSLGHPVIPRPWAEGEPQESFLAHLLDDLAAPLVDERLPRLVVTSWNEWNEDTAIEPVAPGDPTSVDDSRTGRSFSSGFPYAGHGDAFVDVVRDRYGP